MKKNLYPDCRGQAFFLLFLLLLTRPTFHTQAQTIKTQIITTIAGNGIAGYSGNNGSATLATLDSPISIAIDGSGNLYISDQENNAIRKVTPASGGIIKTFAGNKIAAYGGDNGPANLASLNLNWGVAVDGAGNVYIADEQNDRIRKVTAATGIITTIAGNGTSGYAGDGGPATLALLQYPLGIAVDGANNVYFGDSYNFCIRKIDPAGIITTIAGTGIPGYSGDNGPATLARLGLTWGVAADAAGNVYYCDGNNVVRKINTSGIITTIAGTITPGYSGDGGHAISAQLNQPLGVAVDNTGNVYIADYANNRVRMVNTSGIISTIAGNGTQGYYGDGGVATAAELSHPISVTTDDSGSVYITDLDNVRIRKISYVNILSFTGGPIQYIIICENTVLSPINTTLTVVDYDTGPTDTWSLLSAPRHGSVIASFSATATGGTRTPSGLSYTPDTGYIGDDTFKVRVTNGLSSDTTTVFVSVNTITPSAGTITGPSRVCERSKITLSDAVTNGVWGSSNTSAAVSATGIVTGLGTGLDTIIYTLNNSCATAIATKTITVDPLPDAGSIIGASAVCSGSSISITDFAAGGTWSTSNPRASADSGIVTGLSPGMDTIIYTVSNAFCKTTATVPISIDTFTDIGDITGPDVVCIGAKIILEDATVKGGVWNSSNGSATVSSGDIAGIYAGTDTIGYSITNSCGTALAIKIINIYPHPPAPSIIQTEYILSAPSGYFSYQWIKNGAEITGATIDTYLVTNAGTYIVTVTNSFGCSASSSPVTASDCSTDEINIYPNPFQSTLYIKWCKLLTVRIISMDARISKTIANVNEIDMRGLPNGDYLISLFDSNGNKLETKCISKIAK